MRPGVLQGVSTALSRAPWGLAAPLVRVEVHLGAGLPCFVIVGLPEAAVRESKERVRSALLNSGFEFPSGRITVNLSPADLPKESGRFDLPIAVGILAASGQVPGESLAVREFYGELSLYGELRETPRLLPALIAAAKCDHDAIVPAANGAEALLLDGRRVRAARHLGQLCAFLQGRQPLETPAPPLPGAQPAADPPPDLADIRGQFAAKRALEIAAAGEHAMLLQGPPGAGKTLIAQRLPGLLPPLGAADALEAASVASAAGLRPAPDGRRPFRSPQHTASLAALIGGNARPGELSLAHHGVLFLDELPEFARNALEALREPLESGCVALARAKGHCEWPARFQLIAAMNPCPCGYAGDPGGRCRCTRQQVARYRSRISGPLIDRIDIHLGLNALSPAELLADASPPATPSALVARRVAAARDRQQMRQGKLNSRLAGAEIERFCPLEPAGRALLTAAIGRFGLSARAFHKALKIARTVADLADSPTIGPAAMAEALQLRAFDRAIC